MQRRLASTTVLPCLLKQRLFIAHVVMLVVQLQRNVKLANNQQFTHRFRRCATRTALATVQWVPRVIPLAIAYMHRMVNHVRWILNVVQECAGSDLRMQCLVFAAIALARTNAKIAHSVLALHALVLIARSMLLVRLH